MNGCPKEDDLAAFVDGDDAEPRARAHRAHARTCPACQRRLERLELLAADLRAPLGVLGDDSPDAFADGVLARLDERVRPPSAARARIALAVFGAAALAVASMAVVWRRPAGHEQEWASRGGSAGADGVRRVLLRFGRVSGTDFEVLDDGATIGARDVLAVDVGHTGRAPLFLLAFLVDAEGERHWIYPAYELGAAPPSAVPLPSTDGSRVLSTMTRLGDPAQGPARLVGIVLSAPETVEYVERAPARELARDRLAARYPRALVIETKVVVGGGR